MALNLFRHGFYADAMGVDRGLVRAFGFFGFGVVALSAGGAGAIAAATGKPDIVRLFMPLLVAYAIVVIGFWAGLALYFRFRSRLQAHQ